MKFATAVTVAGICLIGKSAWGQMAVEGNVHVTPDGAASYSIPLDAPPQMRHVSPYLALVYNHRAGNGPLGVGWRLSGLSAISRCPVTPSQDGSAYSAAVDFSSRDQFCLDGQRLLLVSGSHGANNSSYRHELEKFDRVVAHGGATNGPEWFSVQTKSGETLEFGKEASSRIDIASKGVVGAWSLNRIVDRKGNSTSFRYTKDSTNNELSVDAIEHTAASQTSPIAAIRFEYDQRPDVDTIYQAGERFYSSKRLKAIRTYSGSELIREYQLGYANVDALVSRSRLRTVKVCKAAQCLPVMSFEYPAQSAEMLTGNRSQDFGGWNDEHRELVLDANGDGRSDVLRIWQSNTSPPASKAELWLSDGSTLTQVSNNDFGGWHSKYKEMSLDANGDGRSDVVRFWNDGTTARAELWLSQGYSFMQVSNANIGGWVDSHRYYILDIDDNGKQDFIKIHEYNNIARAEIWLSNDTYFSWGGTFDIGDWREEDREFVFDANGDGRADIVRIRKKEGEYASTVSVWATRVDPWGTGSPLQLLFSGNFGGWNAKDRIYPMDVNGDGLVDLVKVWKAELPYARAEVWISSGLGFSVASNNQMNVWSELHREHILDVNRDGRQDMVRVWHDASTNVARAETWLATGTGFAPVSNEYMGGWSEKHREYVADVSGSARPSIIKFYRDGGSWNGKMEQWYSVSDNPYLMTQVSNGLGGQVSFSYKPLTDSSVYTKETAIYPEIALQSPMHVVSRMEVPDGRGGVRSTDYFYSGLKANLVGRGVLGFRTVRSVDAITGFETYTEYSQTWPYTGLETLFRVGRAPVMDMQYRTSTYGCKVPEGSATATTCPVAPGNRYFPYLATKVERRKDLNGVLLSDTTTSQQYNAYGDPTQVKVTTPDGYSKTTDNTYLAPDLTNWILGRLQRSKVTSVSP